MEDKVSSLEEFITLYRNKSLLDDKKIKLHRALELRRHC